MKALIFSSTQEMRKLTVHSYLHSHVSVTEQILITVAEQKRGKVLPLSVSSTAWMQAYVLMMSADHPSEVGYR